MSCHIDDPKTDFYLRTRDELDDFVVNQCVIIKEKFLKNIVGLGVDLEEEKRKSPPPPPCEQWYPYVNSYYPYTEDVDAIERVNHLLASRPSVESVASAGNAEWKAEEEVVPYSERATQIAYLESNPLCFVLLGKPGIGEESLAQTLAEYWQCVLVEPNLLVEQEIASGSKAGRHKSVLLTGSFFDNVLSRQLHRVQPEVRPLHRHRRPTEAGPEEDPLGDRPPSRIRARRLPPDPQRPL